MSKERETIRTEDLKRVIDDHEMFERMSLSQRIQHAILVLSFIVLILTGLPFFFPESRWMRIIFFFQHSFLVRGILHRMAAMALMLVSIYHIFYILFCVEGRKFFKEILPRKKDFYDAIATFMHNLGLMVFLNRFRIMKRFFKKYPQLLFNEKPKFGRYNFIEKFEYMAVCWGNIIMIGSGLFLWFEETAMALFPKYVLDIIRVIHGFEAILAFLAIIIWHMYNVHLNPDSFPMSKVWLTGKTSGKELRIHHRLEYEQMAWERIQKRQREEVRM